MPRLTAVRAVWIVVATFACLVVPTFEGTAFAQGLADVRTGNEAFRQGDYEAAVNAYTDAIRSGELVGEALAITYNNRGVAHGEAGNFEAAIADYSQALALRPGDATTIRNLRVAYVRRGEVEFSSGNYDAALADFDAAIEMQADHYLAYLRRGELHAERGELDLARADLDRAAALNPGDPEIMAALERVTGGQGGAVAASEAPAAPPAEQAAAPAAPTTAEEPATAAAEPAGSPDSAAEPAAAPETETAAPAGPDEKAPVVATVPERPAAAESASTESTAAGPAGPEAAETEPAAGQPTGTTAAPPTPAPAPAEARAAGEGQRYRAVAAVNYRAGPDNSAERLGSIDAGREVTVIGDTLGWKHVILPNGDKGYIYKKWLEPVTP